MSQSIMALSFGLTLVIFFTSGAAPSAGAAPIPGHIIAWGENSFGQATAPPLDDVIAVASAYSYSLALRADGTVVGWGASFQGETNIPSGLTNVVAIAAGSFCAALKGDGTVVVWGSNESAVTNIPPAATNIIAVEVAANGVLALRRDGSVIGWGWAGKPDMVIPPGLNGVVEISGGPNHAMVRKSDGTVVGWGYNDFGQASPPPGIQTVRSVEAGQTTSLAVLNDHTVFKWGGTFDSNDVPAGITGILEVDAGHQHVLARRTNGTVLAWGFNVSGQGNVPEEITGVTAIAAGGNHNLVVTARPRLVSITPPVNASVSQSVTFTVTATGAPLTYQWKHRGTNLLNQTNASLTIMRAMPENGGSYSVLVGNEYGQISAATSLNLPPPVIDFQPVSRIVHRGEDVTFSVAASGFPPFTYQWQHNGANVSGATATNLVLPRVDTPQVGKYRVVVTDVTGSSVPSVDADLSIIDPRAKNVVLTPIVDTSIFSSGGKPLGADTILAGLRGRVGTLDRALLRFDLRNIPTNAVVLSARAELTVVRAPNSTALTFHLHRLLTHWDTNANWTQASTGVPWAVPGAGRGTDFTTNSTPGLVSVGAIGFRGVFGPSTNLQSDLQEWVANPALNHGWILLCGSEDVAYSARHFGSSESTNAPQLRITYEIPAAVPEMTSVAAQGAHFNFQINPVAGWFYAIEMREFLDRGSWVLLTNAAAGAALAPISINAPLTNAHRFFRAYRY